MKKNILFGLVLLALTLQFCASSCYSNPSTSGASKSATSSEYERRMRLAESYDASVKATGEAEGTRVALEDAMLRNAIRDVTRDAESKEMRRAATEASYPPHPTYDLPPSCPSGDIDSCNAQLCAGQVKTVCGIVINGSYHPEANGKPTFLDMCQLYPKEPRFTVLIWGEDRAKFPANPEDYYKGKSVCITGLVAIYQGFPQIEAKSLPQLTVR